MKLAHPRKAHTATVVGTDGGSPVLLAGGLDGQNTLIDIAELFDPSANDLFDPLIFHPTMQFPRQGHTAIALSDRSVVFIGGAGAAGPVRALERFTAANIFVHGPSDNVPAEAGIVDFAATRLLDGRILVTGGYQDPLAASPTNYAYIIEVNPFGALDILPTDSMMYARAGHQALLLCDGTVLISGGAPPEVPAERYSPAASGRR